MAGGVGSILQGLVQGFANTTTANRQAAAKERETAMARDAKIFESLLTSDDDEIAAMAATGLLNMSQDSYKPTKGLAKFLGGGAQVNPHLQQLLTIGRAAPTNAPEVEADQATAVAAHPGAASMAPPPSTGAGPRAGQLGTPGAGGEPPPMVDAPPAGAAGVTGPAGMGPAGMVGAPPPNPAQLAALIKPGTSRQPTRITSTATRLFPSASETQTATAKAKAQGDIEGQIAGYLAAGMSEAEARELLRQDIIGRVAGTANQSIAGELADGTPVFAVFDRQQYIDPVTRQPIPGFRPRTTTGSTSMGADREAISRLPQFGGKPYVQLTPAQRVAVDTEVQQRVQTNAFNRTAGGNNADAVAPLSTQQRFAATSSLSDDWKKTNAPATIMRNQLGLMETALQRFQADPVGGSEGVRVTFARILDPLSVVREAEFNRQGAGLSLIDRLVGTIQKYGAGGGNIPLPILQEMVETARQFVAVSQTQNDAEKARIARMAQGFGVNPEDIFGANVVGAPPPTAPGAPAAPTSPVGTAPPAASANPPGAPRVGTVVGNPYTGEVRRTAEGKLVGRVNNQTLELRQVPGTNPPQYVY